MKDFSTDILHDLTNDLKEQDTLSGLSEIHAMTGSLIGAIAEIEQAETAYRVLELTDGEQGETAMVLWGEQEPKEKAYAQKLQEIAEWKRQREGGAR